MRERGTILMDINKALRAELLSPAERILLCDALSGLSTLRLETLWQCTDKAVKRLEHAALAAKPIDRRNDGPYDRETP